MSEKKQIVEEMARHIPARIFVYDVSENTANLDELHREIVALHLYRAGYRKQSGWISVDERLPIGSRKGEMPENIIAYTSNGEVATGWLNVETWYLLYGDNDEHYRHGMGYVTHWMPLPEPPKGD